MTEWWSSETAGVLGGVAGGGAGALAGIFGAAIGILAPRGKARRAVLGIHAGFVIVGMLALLTGLAATILRQPWHVVLPLLLTGFILTVVMGSLWPVVQMRYREAEQRRLQARELRTS